MQRVVKNDDVSVQNAEEQNVEEVFTFIYHQTVSSFFTHTFKFESSPPLSQSKKVSRDLKFQLFQYFSKTMQRAVKNDDVSVQNVEEVFNSIDGYYEILGVRFRFAQSHINLNIFHFFHVLVVI